MRRPFSEFAAVAVVAMAICACTKRAPQPAEQVSFATPDEAVAALVASLEKNSIEELRRMLGPGTDELLSSGDEVQDRAARETFIQQYSARHRLVAGGPNDVVLQVGEDDWPLPIPLVRRDARWYFDGAAGADEIVLRRIGGNELRTIDVMRGFVAAQDEYAATGHDGAPSGIYAQKLRSDPGKHNGLYWEVAAGEAQSPAGPFLAAATGEGYTAQQGSRAPYHGYLYRMLFSQGPDANGGERDYLVDGRLTGGFALLAYPDAYGASGVMTFVVNQDGVVWQRDLGENTAQTAASLEQFDPGRDWTPIALEQ